MFKHIKNVTVAGNATTLNIDNVFDDTYQIYKCIFTDFQVQTQFDNDSMTTRLLDSSGNGISTGYDHAQLYARGFSATYLELKNTSTTHINAVYVSTAANNGNTNGVIYWYYPYAARPTFMHWQVSGKSKYSTVRGTMQKGGGVLNTTAQCRGFQFIARAECGNLTSGKVSVYGLKE